MPSTHCCFSYNRHYDDSSFFNIKQNALKSHISYMCTLLVCLCFNLLMATGCCAFLKKVLLLYTNFSILLRVVTDADSAFIIHQREQPCAGNGYLQR